MVALSNEPRLLIMACSQRKSAHPQLIPAIDRYDGPTYRVLRRYLQNKSQQQVHVYILSAEFGLISSRQPLPSYDRRMTPERACELRPAVVASMSRLLNEIDYHDLFICGTRSEGARRYAATGSGRISGGCWAWGRRDGGGAPVVRAAQASVR